MIVLFTNRKRDLNNVFRVFHFDGTQMRRSWSRNWPSSSLRKPANASRHSLQKRRMEEVTRTEIFEKESKEKTQDVYSSPRKSLEEQKGEQNTKSETKKIPIPI